MTVESDEEEQSGPYVLVIDDDEFFVSLFARALEKRGYGCDQCDSFEQAQELLAEHHYHLIITDIFMPGIGGIEGIKTLRAEGVDLPIIAMSGGWEGMSADKTIEAAKMIGADAGLSKPLQTTQLNAVLEQISPLKPGVR